MPYISIDRAALQQRLIDRLDQPALYDATDLTDAINGAIMALAALTGVWKQREVIALTPNGPYVALPASIMSPIRVTCNALPLSLTNLVALDALIPRWEGQTVADGGSVPARPILWAPAGLYMIAIWPAVALPRTFSIEVDGYQRPPVLMHDGQYLQLEEGQVSTILTCAVHLLTLDQGGDMLAASIKAMQGFFNAAGDLNGKIKGTGTYREVMGVDRARADRPLVIPSTLPSPDVPGDASGGGGQ